MVDRRPKRKLPQSERDKRSRKESSSSSSSSESDDNIPLIDLVPRTPGTLPAVPRCGHVTEKTRKQIRKGEFVQLSQLVPKDSDTSKRKQFTINSESGLFEEVESKVHLTFSSWLDSFIIFISLRIQSAPDETQGLLRHMQLIKNMYSQGKNGVEYDYQFRQAKAQHPTIQWGEYLPELSDEISAKEQKRTRPAWETSRLPIGQRRRTPWSGQPNSWSQQQNKPKHCYKFNSKEGCKNSNCQYPHRCRKCLRMGHPIMNCFSAKTGA